MNYALYTRQASDAAQDAQRNLMGRTHYVDPDTLRFHKSRIVSARVVDRGLLYAIVTSDALDYQNTRRGFRFVVFDLFGNVLARTKLEDAYRKSAQAEKAMWAALNAIDAKAVNLAALDKHGQCVAKELANLAKSIAELA